MALCCGHWEWPVQSADQWERYEVTSAVCWPMGETWSDQCSVLTNGRDMKCSLEPLTSLWADQAAPGVCRRTCRLLGRSSQNWGLVKKKNIGSSLANFLFLPSEVNKLIKYSRHSIKSVNAREEWTQRNLIEGVSQSLTTWWICSFSEATAGTIAASARIYKQLAWNYLSQETDAALTYGASPNVCAHTKT